MKKLCCILVILLCVLVGCNDKHENINDSDKEEILTKTNLILSDINIDNIEEFPQYDYDKNNAFEKVSFIINYNNVDLYFCFTRGRNDWLCDKVLDKNNIRKYYWIDNYFVKDGDANVTLYNIETGEEINAE